MKNKQQLTMYGVGPAYVYTIILLTASGMGLSASGKLPVIRFDFLKIPLTVLGIAMILFGALLWVLAVFKSKIDKDIKSNTLVTSGVYAYVRNPIYSAFMIACTGVLLIYGNLCLLVLPIIFWMFLTALIKNTEEKWLSELYGEEYEEYCRKVNRCIPWVKKV